MKRDRRRPCLIVGYDGSSASRAAIEWDARRAGQAGKVVVVYASGPPPECSADPVIRRCSMCWDADEIVVGSRGFGRVRGALGSVSHELVHLADRPLVVVPERSAQAPRGEATSI